MSFQKIKVKHSAITANHHGISGHQYFVIPTKESRSVFVNSTNSQARGHIRVNIGVKPDGGVPTIRQNESTLAADAETKDQIQ